MKKVIKKVVPIEIAPEVVKTEGGSLIKLIPIVLGVLVLAGLAGAYFKYWNIAVVNGRGISRIEYFKLLEKQGGKQVLSQMVQETLIQQEAEKNKLTIEKSVVDTQIATIEGQIKSQGQTLDTALAAEGMTKADLEKQIRLQKIVEALSKPTTEITQQQIDDFLTKNSAQLPKTATKDELQSLAKTELAKEAGSSAVTTWLDTLKKEAKIIYR